MPSDDVSISVSNLTKTYRIFGHPGDRIKQAMTLGLRKYNKEYTALKDVSFNISKGEAVGIIGRNGSGKSTLLQIICGIIKPTSGTVQVNGRISALLELGAGFNPEFTGRENVYFQGALMGMIKAEMDERFDDIAAFADIGDFIDQPVRTYSSGMFVRLAFATMIHIDADILVIDEALAVGDEAFQRKCFDKLAEYFEGNEKVLFFVSHNTRQVERICSKTIWLQEGGVAKLGASTDVCNAYQSKMHEEVQSAQGIQRPLPNVAYSGEVEVLRIRITPGHDDISAKELEIHAPAKVIVEFSCNKQLVTPEINIGFHTTDSIFIAATSTADLSEPPSFPPGGHRIECLVPDMMLLPGVYMIQLAFFDRYRRSIWIGHRLCSFRVVASIRSNMMRIPQGLVDMPFEWVFNQKEMMPIAQVPDKG